MAKVVVAHVENEVLDLGRATRASAFLRGAVRSKNDETIVIDIGLCIIRRLSTIEIDALGKLFPEIQYTGPNPEVLSSCPKIDDFCDCTLSGNKPKCQPAAEGQVTR
jgi:hypothetical protein